MTVTCLTLGFPKLLAPILWSLLVGTLPVVVRTSSGEQVEGQLAGFSDKSVRLEVSGETRELAFDELTSLRPADGETRTGPIPRVTLVSGSKIAADALASTDNALVIEPRRQNRVEVPLKQVKSVRFRAASSATDPQWLGILERDQRGDVLVIRRAGDRLDPQQGLITSVKTEIVQFDLDGTVVNAPVDRLEGVVFGGTDRAAAEATIQVSDVYGSLWSVRSIEPSAAGEPLRIELSGGVKHQVPWDQIDTIRFSGGVRMLAEERPAAESYRPYLATSIDARLQNALFGLQVIGEADLQLHGGGMADYRIEPGYQTFAGAVRRHEDVRKSSSLSIRIDLDGKTVWRQTLLDTELRGFELPLNDARRLTIHVESDGDGDLGDSLRMVRPRFLK